MYVHIYVYYVCTCRSQKKKKLRGNKSDTNVPATKQPDYNRSVSGKLTQLVLFTLADTNEHQVYPFI